MVTFGKVIHPVDLDVWVLLIVLQPDIVARPVFLDQVHLEDQCLELRSDHDPFYVGYVRYQFAGLVVPFRQFVEVAAHPAAKVYRLPDIDHRTLAVLHDITAGFEWQCIQDTLNVRRDFHPPYFNTKEHSPRSARRSQRILYQVL